MARSNADQWQILEFMFRYEMINFFGYHALLMNLEKSIRSPLGVFFDLRQNANRHRAFEHGGWRKGSFSVLSVGVLVYIALPITSRR